MDGNGTSIKKHVKNIFLFTFYKFYSKKWNDEKLRWNESDYGNLTRIALAQHEIWQPDISLYNSATGSNNDYFGNTHFFVEPNGTVLWVPPSTFKTFCDSDLRYWPFDSHKCTLLFGSWIYNGEGNRL